MLARLGASALALAAAGIVYGALSEPIAWREGRPIAHMGWKYQVEPIPFGHTVDPDGLHTYTVPLFSRDVAWFLQWRAVELQIATNNTEPTLAGAEIRLSSDCVYRAPPGALRDNALLRFERDEACHAVVHAGDIPLQLRFAAPAAVALWTYIPRDIVESSTTVYAGTAMPNGIRRLAIGRLIGDTAGQPRSRSALLAFLWQTGWPRYWPYVALAMIASVIAGAIWTWPSAAAPVSPALSARLGLSAALLAFGIASAYAVFVPPLHAPDEPSHFASFWYAHGHHDITRQVSDWAALGHFERLQFQTSERFGPQDISSRDDTPTDDVVVLAVEDRSPLTLRTWRVTVPLVADAPLGIRLLAIRLMNAGWLALTIGIAGGLCAWAGAASAAAWPVLWLLAVPSLGFFGMHVSNHAWLLGTYVLMAGAVSMLCVNAPRAWIAGPLMGAASGLALGASRSALPMAPMLALILIAVAMSRPSRDEPLGLRFWGGLAAAAVIGLVVSGGLGGVALPRAVLDRLPLGGSLPPAVLILATGLAGAALGFVLERTALRPSLSWLGRPAGYVAAAWAGAVLAIIVSPLVTRLPHLRSVPPFEGRRPPAGEYLQEAIATWLTRARIADADFLLTGSFWTGFGWLDNGISPAVGAAAAALLGVALCITLIRAAVRADTARVMMVAATSLGAAASVLLYAWITLQYYPDIHGRYLLGIYALTIVAAFSFAADVDADTRRRFLLAAAFTVALALHGWWIFRLLERYF